MLSIGDFNLGDSAVNSEIRLYVLEHLFDRMLRQQPITDQIIKQLRDDAVKDLQKRFPEAGIGPKNPS